TRLGIRGRDGRELEKAWDDGPWNYLGLCVPGFPNMFNLVGPLMPAGNIPTTAERNAAMTVELIGVAEERGATRIEAEAKAADAWRAETIAMSEMTLAHEAAVRARSWFMGANIEGKAVRPVFYTGPAWEYMNSCERERAAGYPNFRF